MTIYVNGRFKSHKVTGLQRYAHEVSGRLLPLLRLCEPRTKLRGWRGHLWEQTVLPLQSRSGLLWSPCASGPLSSRRQIVTFHDLFPLESPQWYSKHFVAWYSVLLNQLAKASAHIIAVSNYTKTKLLEFFQLPEDKITVIYHGIDRTFFDVNPAAVCAAIHAMRLPSSRYLLYVGSLEPRKNLARLLAAWAKVCRELPPDLWLVVAGSGDLRVYEAAGVGPLPQRVHLTGYVPDTHLPGLYAGSSGFLYPSLAEGFGFPPLEAMAAGVPVLTSNASALPEICGPHAIYTDPNDVQAIARSIKMLVTDGALCRRLAEAGPDQARLFNWDRAANQTMDLLQREARRLEHKLTSSQTP